MVFGKVFGKNNNHNNQENQSQRRNIRGSGSDHPIHPSHSTLSSSSYRDLETPYGEKRSRSISPNKQRRSISPVKRQQQQQSQRPSSPFKRQQQQQSQRPSSPFKRQQQQQSQRPSSPFKRASSPLKRLLSRDTSSNPSLNRKNCGLDRSDHSEHKEEYDDYNSSNRRTAKTYSSGGRSEARSKRNSKSRSQSRTTVTTAASSSASTDATSTGRFSPDHFYYSRHRQHMYDELDQLAALQPNPATTIRIVSPDSTTSHSAASTQPTTDSESRASNRSPTKKRQTSPMRSRLQLQRQQQDESGRSSVPLKQRVVSPLRFGRRQSSQQALASNAMEEYTADPVIEAVSSPIKGSNNNNNRSSRGSRGLFTKKYKKQSEKAQNSSSHNNKLYSPKRRSAGPSSAIADAAAAMTCDAVTGNNRASPSSSEYGEATAVTYLGRHEVKIYADRTNDDPSVPNMTDATLPSMHAPSSSPTANGSPSSGGGLYNTSMVRSSSDLDDLTITGGGPNGGGSDAGGSLTLGSFSRTQVAGNLTMTPSSLLLSGIVTLSLVRSPYAADANKRTENGGAANKNNDGLDPVTKFQHMSSTARTVQESLDRHIQFQLSRYFSSSASGENNNQNMNNGPGKSAIQQTNSFDNNWNGSPSYSLDSSSLYDSPNFFSEDRVDINSAARECLKEGNVDGAIAVYRTTLEKQEKSLQNQEDKRVITFGAGSSAVGQFDTFERVETLSKLSILLLYAGRNQEAMETANQASALILQDNPFAETRPLQAVMITMAVGLIHLSTGRVNKALESWRQTIQTCCQALGYDHPIVAVLMNNIGVLHAESGDAMAASKALEESLQLQRSLLKSGPLTDTDYALHQMATTMSNLSMVLELQEEFNAAINYLQEAQALYESVEDLEEPEESNDIFFGLTFRSGSLTSNPPATEKTTSSYHNKIQMIVHYHLDRLHVARQDYLDRKVRYASSTLLESKSDDDASSDASEPIEDPEATEDAVMKSLVEKRSRNGKHAVQQGHRKTLQLSDIYDYILLGSIRSEWTPRERVRETVLAWFGRPSVKTHSNPITSTLFGLSIGAKTQIHSREPIKSSWDDKKNDSSSLMSQAKLSANNRVAQKPDEDPVERAFAPVRAEILRLIDRNDPVSAMDVCQTALEKYKSSYSEDHGLVGMALHMTGMLHLLAEEYLQAYGVLKEAVKVRKAAHGADDAKVASTLMKLALLQYAAMDIPASGRTMGEIRGTYLKVMGFGHPHLAQIMNNIAILRYEQGDIGAAIRALEIAYEYQRKIIEDNVKESDKEIDIDPDHAQVAEVVMAYTLSNIAFLYYHKDDQLSSLRLYEEARGILSRHAPPSDRVMLQIQDSIECLMGRGVEMVPCDERCRITEDGTLLAQSAQCSPEMANIHKMWKRT